MSLSAEDVKTVLRQYVLVKGNDTINEALIDRVTQILLREFEITSLSRLSFGSDPIDLSDIAMKGSLEQNQEEIKILSKRVEAGSSETAHVEAMAEEQKRTAKSFQEQTEEVEAQRHLPPPPIPSEEERAKMRPAEGQRAVSTTQQNHFHSVIDKVIAKSPESARGSKSIPEDYDETDIADDEIVEVSEGNEQIVDIADTDLNEIFGSVNTPSETNPKDAMSLQRSLPKKLDGVSDSTSKGKNRSISRVES